MTTQLNPVDICMVFNEFSPVLEKTECMRGLDDDVNPEAQVNVLQSMENGDLASDTSSSSEYIEVELPTDVQDGPEFRDLAKHIDNVCEAVGAQQESRNLSLSGTHHLDAAIPYALKNEMNEGVCGDENSRFSQSPRLLETFYCTKTKPHTGENNMVLSSEKLSLKHEDTTQEEFAAFSDFDNSVLGSDAWASAPIRTESISPSQRNWSGSGDSCTTTVPDIDDGEDIDEFGDFASSAPLPHSEDSHKFSSASGTLERLLSHLESALIRVFPSDKSSTCVSDNSVSALPGESCVTGNTVIKYPVIQKPSLWQKVLPLPRTHDHRFHWKKSPIYEAYLHSVHVDPRCAMPAFASQLRLLEPVRLGSTASNSSHLTDSSAPVPPTKSCVPSTEVSTTLPSMKAPSSESPEFDWNSSGLTNPLQEPAIDTVQLDLDYFEMQHQQTQRSKSGISNTNTIADLERELFCELPTPPVAMPKAPQLITTISTQQSTAPSTSERSRNVRAALMRIPKLTYMRARCLIFPVTEEKNT